LQNRSIRSVLTAIAANLLFVILCLSPQTHAAASADVIRVGILHSQTGAMAASEQPVINATLLAIEQINAAGGLLGKPLQVVMADGKSDENVFATEAGRLISEEHVDVIFGCWTSASRKAVRPVVEALKNLLFYPLQYEGMEQSEHIVYVGATPSQQIIPAISWAVRTFGTRVYLVGSDYVFPRVANWLIHKQLNILQAEQVGESYVRLGATDLTGIVADISKQYPDVIINTINGDANTAFFHALKAAGIGAKDTPVLSFSLDAATVQAMPADEIAGHYVAWSYIQSLPNPQNRAFITAFEQRFGQQPISDPMETAWVGVHLWANAVRHANSSDPQVIRSTVLHQSLVGPEGIVSIDQSNRHTWKTARIARINVARRFDLVWASDHALKPYIYPLFVDKKEARQLLDSLYKQWGNQWTRPNQPQGGTQP